MIETSVTLTDLQSSLYELIYKSLSTGANVWGAGGFRVTVKRAGLGLTALTPTA